MAKTKKKTTVTKTIVTPGTKVSQGMIDDIKRLGMTKALALAGKNGNPAGGLASEFQEGVRRMYGARRLEAAKAQYAPLRKSPRVAERAAAAKPKPKPTAKNNNKSNLLKAVGGTVAAVGLLAAGKGKGASAAAKLSPAVGNFAKSGLGKALFGTGEKISTKALSTSGRVTAKAGKPVSQAQLDAMKATAKAKGIKTPAAKAKATKVATKPISKKKLLIAGTGASTLSLKGDTKTKKR
jgi:hypothetical protein